MTKPKRALVLVEMSFWVAVDAGAEKLLNGGEESFKRAAEAAHAALCDVSEPEVHSRRDVGNPKFLLRPDANHYTVRGR